MINADLTIPFLGEFLRYKELYNSVNDPVRNKRGEKNNLANAEVSKNRGSRRRIKRINRGEFF